MQASSTPSNASWWRNGNWRDEDGQGTPLQRCSALLKRSTTTFRQNYLRYPRMGSCFDSSNVLAGSSPRCPADISPASTWNLLSRPWSAASAGHDLFAIPGPEFINAFVAAISSGARALGSQGAHWPPFASAMQLYLCRPLTSLCAEKTSCRDDALSSATSACCVPQL
jgi:hypothetical protein